MKQRLQRQACEKTTDHIVYFVYVYVYVYVYDAILFRVYTMSMRVSCIPYVYRFFAPPAKSPKGRGLYS